MSDEKRRVAVMGTAPSSIPDAPLDDPEWEVWGTSRLWKMIPRQDIWFELHDLDQIGRGWDCTEKERRDQRAEHMEWLAEADIPVYLQSEDERIPNGRRYPLEQIIETLRGRFGDTSRYFTNTISYMLAYALYCDVDEVGIWGVDMALDCLAPDERVLTAELRWVPARDLHEGDEILAFDEHTGKKMPGDHHTRRWRVATVEGRSKADRPCYRIYLEDGRTIVASEGHKWLTYGEHQMKWKRTDELVTNMHRDDRPTRIHSPIDTWEEDISRDGGYLAAAFDGEGHLNQARNSTGRDSYACTVHFSQRDNAMADRVRQVLEMRGYRWSESAARGTGTDGRPLDATITYNVLGGRSEVMRLLGQVRPQRLLDGFDPSKLGQFTKNKAVAVEKIEPLGEQETIGFTTSTGTMVVEGMASHNSEYMRQRPSVEYWIGLLRGAGIPVTVPASCDLLQTAHLYGYEHEESKRFLERLQAREKELGGRKDQTENQIQKLAQVRAGALTTADYFDEFLSNGYKIPDPMQRDMSELVQTARAEGKQAEAEIEQLKRKAEHLSGAKSDVEYIRRTFVGGA